MAESDGLTAPADARETAQAPGWRIGPLVVASGLAVSVLVHLGLLGTVLFVSPLFGRPAPVYSVPVELVTADEVPKDKPAPKTDQPAKTPEPDPQTQAQTQTQPRSPTQSAASPPSFPLDAYSPTLSMPPASPDAAPPPPPSAHEQLANLIGLPLVGPSGGPSEFQADLAADAIAAFRARVQTCWATPAALANGPNINVIIRVNLRRDGSLAAEPELVSGSPSLQARDVLQPSAIGVLKKCQPYAVLPAEKYAEWRVLDLLFTPNGLVAARPPDTAKATPPG